MDAYYNYMNKSRIDTKIQNIIFRIHIVFLYSIFKLTYILHFYAVFLNYSYFPPFILLEIIL